MHSDSQFSDDDDSISIRVNSSSSERFDKKSATNDFYPKTYEDGSRVFSPECDIPFTDSLIVNNDKIRYYYNKTLCLRVPIGEMMGQLENIHCRTFAYLSQFPETGDYSIIGTLFELIPTVSTMIDWNNLNHSCYWDDFCRETKQISFLLDKVNGAALKCCDTASDILAQVNDIFGGVVESNQPLLKIDRALSYRKSSDYMKDNPRGKSIQIHWKKPGDMIDLQWHDADGGLINVSLNQTGTGFRLRFLRHIIYHCRTCLEEAYITFMKLNVALHLHIPIEKLAKCQDVEMKKLTQQERAFLTKAKREFDRSMDTVWKMVSRFKFQTFQLFKYNATLKGMRSSRSYAPNTGPTFMKLSMNVDDSLLMRVISSGILAQAKEESFDFTVYPDRTEDISAKIEDLLAVDIQSYHNLQHMLSLIKVILPKEKKNLSSKELSSVNEEIQLVFAHRFRLRRWLKKSIEVFESHSAFHKMDKLKLLPALKDISAKKQNSIFLEESQATIRSSNMSSENTNKDGNNNKDVDTEESWITLQGGIKVKYGQKAILAQFPYKNGVKLYAELSTDERIILTVRLIRHFLVLVVNEQCWAKVSYDRIYETKSLVKRLKAKDRTDNDLQNAILEQQRHLRKMLKLTKVIRFLKKY